MNILPNEQNEFLEAALRDLMQEPRKASKILVAYLDEDNAVTFSYHKCTYSDLQHIGQELINEGMLWLIGANKDRIDYYEQIEGDA